MIDIHSHVLFDIDDGAQNIEESINIIKMQKSLGYTGIIVTPHYKPTVYCQTTDNIIKRIDKIRNELEKQNIEFNIYIGNEIYIFPQICERVENGDVARLNNSRYVLVELPRYEYPLYTNDVIFNLINKEFIPIIAHPERYEYIQKDIQLAKNLVDAGALLQVNASSLINQHGWKAKRTMKKLLKNNLVSFVATDTHHINKMHLKYDKILKKIKKIVGEEEYKKIIYDNPRRVRDNLEIH